jgi:hypothetical protein
MFTCQETHSTIVTIDILIIVSDDFLIFTLFYGQRKYYKRTNNDLQNIHIGKRQYPLFNNHRLVLFINVFGYLCLLTSFKLIIPLRTLYVLCLS